VNDTEDVEGSIAPYVQEVLRLRSEASIPSSAAIPQAVLDSLLEVRAKADRVEEINIRILHLRHMASRRVTYVQAQVDDAWAQAIVDLKKAGSRSGDQYEGPRERYAQADLATLALKRELRKEERLLSHVDEASDIVKMALRGLNEVIQDHRIWLRTLQVQSYIEK
jgi:hypothetical protein